MDFRRALLEDEALLLRWRNEPSTRAASLSPGEIAPGQHHAWFTRKLADPDCVLFILEEEGRPVGQLRLDRVCPELAEVSVGVDLGARGRGLGREALRSAACEAERLLGVKCLKARVKRDNASSLAALAAAGFCVVAEDAEAVELRHVLGDS
jgi:RimJ/RimL family protein N-acetyltransferase